MIIRYLLLEHNYIVHTIEWCDNIDNNVFFFHNLLSQNKFTSCVFTLIFYYNMYVPVWL